MLKRYAELVTDLKHNHFSRAVLRLTVYYALSAFFILSMYSTVIFVLYVDVLPIEHDIEIDPETSFIHGIKTEPLDHELREHLITLLLYTDLFLFILSIVVGYFLSKAALKPIQQMHERQRRFIAEAAHEFRTPIAALLGGAGYFSGHERTVEEYKEFVQVVEEESSRLGTLTSDMLYLAKHDTAHTLRLSTLNMTELVRQVVHNMKWYAKEKRVHIHETIAENISVRGDSEQLTRMVQNVLKNAIDYSGDGVRTDVSLVREKDTVILRVSDTGIGIPEEELESIFEPFYTVDTSRSRGTSGTGLGLSIVRHIVTSHRGDISVDSKLEKGTTFTIAIPAETPVKSG